MTPTRVAILMLNWNGAHHTLTCLRSVLASTGNPYTMTVLDNGSLPADYQALLDGLSTLDSGEISVMPPPTDYAETLQAVQRLGCITLLRSADNLGFAGGCNLGIRYLLATQPDTEFILILNNDLTLRPDSLATLLHTAQEHQASITAPLVRGTDGLPTFYAQSWPRLLFEVKRFSHIRLTATTPRVQRCDAVHGAAILLSRPLLAQRLAEDGYVFDPGYFMYWEETDLCVYARQHGHTIVVTQATDVTHAGAASTGGAGNPRIRYYLTRNMLYIAHRWLPCWLFVLFCLQFLSIQAAMGIEKTLQRDWLTLRATAHGLFDALCGRRGKWKHHG